MSQHHSKHSNLNRGNRNNNSGTINRHGKPNHLAGVKNEPFVAGRTYQSKFVPARTKGLMADIRVAGRIVFAGGDGPQPQNDGKLWSFQIVGENNPRNSVFFAQMIVPGLMPRIQIDKKTGKIVCRNRRAMLIVSTNDVGKKKRLAEFRHASPKDAFVREEDYHYDSDLYASSVHGLGSDEGDHDCDHDHGHDRDVSAFAIEMASPAFGALRNHPVHCHSCGFQDCRCDGTATLMPPDRMTLNILA